MTSIEKFGFYASIVGIIMLLCLIVFSENGILDYRSLSDKEKMISERIDQKVKENQILEKEVKGLKADMNYIKHVAKHEHDMAEENELIFKEKSEPKRD